VFRVNLPTRDELRHRALRNLPVPPLYVKFFAFLDVIRGTIFSGLDLPFECLAANMR
jgi:hypothetical protein